MFHTRKNTRLQDYDYAQQGMYFVTICTQDRQHLFGEILDSVMHLNAMGDLVTHEWQQTAVLRDNVLLDAFVVMPNHVHGIVHIARRGGMPSAHSPTSGIPSAQSVASSVIKNNVSQTLGAIIRGFKSSVTMHINETRGVPRMPLWQRNYYDHIIRDDEDLNRVRQYIVDNPKNWLNDELR